MGKYISLLCLLLLLTGCNESRAVDYDQVSPSEKLIIRFPYVTGENTPKGLAVKRLKDLVAQRSGGRVEIQAFSNSGLYTDAQEIDQLQKGNIQMIAPHTAKFSALIPEVQLLDLPYLFTSMADVRAAMNGPAGAELQQLLAAEGLKLLAVWDNGFKQITTNTKPIRKPDDLAGLSFRIAASRAIQQQFQIAGATSVMLPFDELYQALESGRVDGEENTVSNISNKRLYMLQKYMTKSDHSYLGYFVVTTSQFWDSIPAETQTMLEETIAEVTEWERGMAAQMEEEQYAHLQKQLSIYELSAAEKQEWQDAFRSTYDWYMREVDNKLLEEYVRQRK